MMFTFCIVPGGVCVELGSVCGIENDLVFNTNAAWFQ